MNQFWFVLLNIIIDIAFGLDICVAFRTTFYDVDTGDEVWNGKRSAMGYLKTRFPIDLISTIPIDNIMFVITNEKKPVFALFSLLKLVRVTRLGRIIARLNVK